MKITAKASLTQASSKKGFDKIKKRLDRTNLRAISVGKMQMERDVREVIVPVIMQAFGNHRVIKGLLGSGPDDLPAEFGLTDEEAASFVEQASDIVEAGKYIQFDNKLPITRKSGKVSAQLGFSYFDDKFIVELSRIPEASYVSPPSSSPIHWFRWTIWQDDRVDEGYDIEYDLDTKESGRSRSGRALMIPNGGRYDLPESVKSSYNNWVEEIFRVNESLIRKVMFDYIAANVRPNFRQALKETK